MVTPNDLHERLAPLVQHPHLAIVLDYDGTLVPIEPVPGLAAPDPQLMALLGRLTAVAGVTVHVVSGRPREVLDGWLGMLPITLWAEHGYWHRAAPGQAWLGAGGLPERWRETVEPIIDHVAAATPGSWLERKAASITWHYRLADPVVGARQADDLRTRLSHALNNQPLEVREGKKTLEVRLRGVHKGLVIHSIVTARPAAAVIAAGDDDTDEDMFAALPPALGRGVHIGPETSRAQYSLEHPSALRQWLELLISTRPRPTPSGVGD